MFESDAQNYYEILDVRPDASQNEIRQAYFRAKAAYSKDSAALYSLFAEHETRLVIEAIEQAYLVLSSPEKRKEYDKVHGFLRTADVLPTVKRAPTNQNVFSFGRGAESASADPAQQAAAAVFGTASGSMADVGDGGFPASPSSETAPTAPATTPAASGFGGGSSLPGLPGAATPATAVKPTRDPIEDYSTPRTLASAGAAGPPVQEYVSSSFSARENRLGIVRRIDLVKPFERAAAVEDEIAREEGFRGEFFRKVRQYKGITVDELSEFTKISRSYINCIESEEFESLPAPAYLRGFILQIAKALKLPHEKAATAYMAHYKNTVLK